MAAPNNFNGPPPGFEYGGQEQQPKYNRPPSVNSFATTVDEKDKPIGLDVAPGAYRNQAERLRLGGLQRPIPKSVNLTPDKGLVNRIEHWLVNEGQQRIALLLFLILQALLFAFGMMNYILNDDLSTANAQFGITYALARAGALAINVDVIFLIFAVCRNLISVLRRTPLNGVIPFDKHINLHKATAWAIVFFSLLHIATHMNNFRELAILKSEKHTTADIIRVFVIINVTTGTAMTGWFLTWILLIMAIFAIEPMKRQPNGGYERFWYTHHLYIPFFVCWQLHGMFCMIQANRQPACSFEDVALFWRFWLVPGVIFTFERILREVRSRHDTVISKVIQHPSNVVEVQIKKEKTTIRAGQYVFINCPEVSLWQWHPFTLTSAPEEDYISIHIRCVGDFTNAFAKALGCDFSKARAPKALPNGEEETAVVADAGTLNKNLPRVMIDGPFGSASEDFFKFETVLLVGAGIGVTPFASILKTIWYRLNDPSPLAKRSRLRKVYFTWVIRDFDQAEWFHSLLHAIEEQDTENRIEINIYLTGKVKPDDINNIYVQDVGADRDAITTLRAPTHFGRPNWDNVFTNIAETHMETDVGVFFCGPPVLSKQLHKMSNKYTNPDGTRFFFGKENF